MFQFPAYAPSTDGDRPSACRVAPFGCPRINSCLPIPADFRSLPRPSSPVEAKASAVRSFFLRLESFASRSPGKSKLVLKLQSTILQKNSVHYGLSIVVVFCLQFIYLVISLNKSMNVPRRNDFSETGCKGNHFFSISKYFR